MPRFQAENLSQKFRTFSTHARNLTDWTYTHIKDMHEINFFLKFKMIARFAWTKNTHPTFLTRKIKIQMC